MAQQEKRQRQQQRQWQEQSPEMPRRSQRPPPPGTNPRQRRWKGWFLLALLLSFLGPQLGLILRDRPRVASRIAAVTPHQYAIVFGAAVVDENTLTDVTRERVEAAVLLYWHGRVRYLFISGDNRQAEQAEAMGRYAIARGVPESQVIIDPLGIDTQDTCRHFVGLDRRAVLVTQGFHLSRAMLLCDRLGLETTGLAANRLGLLASRGSSRLEIVWIRTARFLREAGLTWSYLLGLYRHISQEAEQLEQELGTEESTQN